MIEKQKGKEKTARIPIKVVPQPLPQKPEWIRMRIPQGGKFRYMKAILREHALHTVCEEAACPNISECFGAGTATFMILGDVCTRRCPFCDVAHGRPQPVDEQEALKLADVIAQLELRYVVITSVDRDDLRDGGAGHFASCVSTARQRCPQLKIEILIPDFRGRLETALDQLAAALPDVLNHNLETVPRLYQKVRPGADYRHSLRLLQEFKSRFPAVPTKSGLMLGVGETDEEIVAVMQDLRDHQVDMLTLGQYLQPGEGYLPVERFVTPEQFAWFGAEAQRMGFTHAACGPMVRSSYHADLSAHAVGVV